MKKQNGITLVALVITIIVLLILAGVSISLALGNNGVLTRASSAVNANEIGTVKQELGLTIQDAQGRFYEAWTTKGTYQKSTPYFEKETTVEGKKVMTYTVTSPDVFTNNCTSASEVKITDPAAATSVNETTAPTVTTANTIKGEYKMSNGNTYYFAINWEQGKLTSLKVNNDATELMN